MHKAYQFDGQFYVRHVGAPQHTVPIDNFIFYNIQGDRGQIIYMR